jgi:sugar transferase (PEP-CTERM/EpsH1 system associated)
VRILFLAHRLPFPPNKGDKIRSYWELRALSERHEVDLFCFYDDPSDAQYVDKIRKYCKSCYAEKLSPFWAKVRALAAALTGRAFSLGYFYSPKMDRAIKRALSAKSYDMIFVFCSAMAPYVKEAAGCPKVLDMVDVDSLKWKQYERRSLVPLSWLWSLEAKRLAKFENLTTEKFNVTLLCTRVEAEALREHCPSPKIGSWEHPLDLDYFDPNKVEVTAEIVKWQPYIIFTGSMDYFPNVDGTLHFYRDVLPLVRAQVPNVRFVIAGRNPAPALLKLASDPSILVTGSVPDIRPYLRGAAMAVVPLRVAQGVQNKLIEAMAMGLPVASSRLAAAALPESLASLLIVEDDPQVLAGRIVKVLREGHSVSGEAQRHAVVGYYDAARMGRQLEEILMHPDEFLKTRAQGRASALPTDVTKHCRNCGTGSSKIQVTGNATPGSKWRRRPEIGG